MPRQRSSDRPRQQDFDRAGLKQPDHSAQSALREFNRRAGRSQAHHPLFGQATEVEMMRFDEDALTARLAALCSDVRRRVFAASCAQRLAPAYIAFCDEVGGQESRASSFLGLLANGWSSLTSPANAHSFDAEQAIEVAMDLIPDESFASLRLYPFAEDASSSLAYLLRSWVADVARECAWAGRVAYEASDQAVLRLRGSPPRNAFEESDVLSSPIVQHELGRQERDLVLLRRDASDAGLAVELRQLAAIDGQHWQTLALKLAGAAN